MSRVGVVVMAHGTPRGPEEIEAFYTRIRRGNPPAPEQLAELTARYEAIGGTSPLLERTQAQVRAIGEALEAMAPGRYDLVLGQKNASPNIEDAVAELAGRDVHEAVGLVLAPHFAAYGVGQYLERAETAGDREGVTLSRIESWHLEPAYLDFLAASICEQLADLPTATKVLFTAHSLPERVLTDDPYPDQLQASAAEIAARAGLRSWPDWAVAWQSAGRTPEPWRGPDVLDVIRDLAETGRAEGVLVCPQGFVADHLEVLYDLDIEARDVAEAAGLRFARTDSVNDEPTVMAALATRVHAVATVATDPPA